MIDDNLNDLIKHRTYKNLISEFSLVVSDVLKSRFVFRTPIEFYSGHELLTAIGIEEETVVCEVNNSEIESIELTHFSAKELRSILKEIHYTIRKATGFQITEEGKIYSPLGNLSSLEEMYEYVLETM